MMSFSLKSITGILLVSISANSFAVTVQSLTMPLAVGYESNPQLSATNKNAISRVTLNPNYSITSNDGPNQWFSTASLNLVRTSDQDISQDRNDPSLNVGWKHDYEIGQFSVTGFLNDQSTRVSEFTDSGLISGDNTKTTRSLSVNWRNSLTDRTSLTLGGSVTEASFHGTTTTDLVNYINETSNVRLGYTLSEKTEVFTELFYSVYRPEATNSLDSKTKSLNLGITWSANERLNLTASAGLNESKTENTNSDQNWQASLDMQYATLRTNSHFSLSRSQSASSLGSITESNRLLVDWSYDLSERDNVEFQVSWLQNLTPNTTETEQFSANYTREISLAWDFRLSAEHKAREDDLTNASSSSIMASIIYKLSDF